MPFRWVEDTAELDSIGIAIVDLINLTVADDGMLGYPELLTPDQGRDFIRQTKLSIAHDGTQLLCCEIDQEVRGMLMLKRSASPTTRHIANLSKCITHPTVRHTAVFIDGLRLVAKRAKELAVEILTLDVRGGTKAYKLWQHCGFRTYGTLPDYARYRGISYEGHYLWQRTVELEKTLISMERGI